MKDCWVHAGVKQGWQQHTLQVHAIRVTHPKLSNAIRVAVTHPSSEKCSEGGSDTPCTVTDKAMGGGYPHLACYVEVKVPGTFRRTEDGVPT